MGAAAEGQRLVVIGAGIAGLAAAFAAAAAARAQGVALDIRVLERARVVGGKAQTRAAGGWRLEGGPTGYLDNEPAMDRLVSAAGLDKLTADPAAARRFLVRGKRLVEIQPHPLKFATSGILSPLGVLRLATEPWRRRGALAQATFDAAAAEPAFEESVWEFARRRLGRQAADRLIGPMVLGVFAGDAKRISLPAAFPRMAELEAEHGSLIRAMIALKKSRAANTGGPAGPAGQLTSFAEGMHALPQNLAARGQANGDFSVHCGVEVCVLDFANGMWRIRTQPSATGSVHAETLTADAVIVATEGFAAADLLADLAPPIATELRAIPTPHVAVVGLGYGPAALAAAPRGFGALVKRGQGLRLLGVLWDTHLFPERSPDGTLLMRCMFGGATDPAIARLDDQALLDIARTELARLFRLSGADAQPLFSEVVRWPRAIPQYELGHLARVQRIRTALAALPAGLQLAGNYLDGVAFTKAARSGLDAGAAVLAR